MSNFDMAKQYGLKMARMTKKGGFIGLGLVGSGLDQLQVNALFQEINKVAPVKLIKANVGVSLCMEKL